MTIAAAVLPVLGTLAAAGAICVTVAGARLQESVPILSKPIVDPQRRLVVTWTAPDTMQYGGHLYLDNDPKDAEPGTGDPRYGTFMYCNNKSTCIGRWNLPQAAGSGPFTFTTEPLDCTRFPAGTYWVQLESYNQDPHPSTRQWEESAVFEVALPACGATTGGGGASGGGGNPASSQRVTFTTTATIVHADGTTSQAKAGSSTVIVDEDVIHSATAPIKLALKEGRLVLGPHTSLAWLLGADGGYWQLMSGKAGPYAGEVWLSGQHRMLVAAGGQTVVRMVGQATVVVQTRSDAKATDTVTVLKGKVSVAGSPDDTKPITLSAGFQVFHTRGQKLSTPKRGTPPGSPFWK